MIIERYQRDAEEMIRRVAFFDKIPVIVDETGEMDAEVAGKSAGHNLWIVIEVTKGRIRSKDLGPKSITLDVLFTVTELPALNRDHTNQNAIGVRATDVVEQLFCVFSPAAQIPLPCIAEEFELLGNINGRLSYQVRATASAGWKQKAAPAA